MAHWLYLLGMKKNTSLRQVPVEAKKETDGHMNSIQNLSRLVESTVIEQQPMESIAVSSGKKLIVTYDNNDPEFDEDSDPDADLDIWVLLILVNILSISWIICCF